jgi:predicted AlkP superfamily pyrophosphatase or phosphodiesterase
MIKTEFFVPKYDGENIVNLMSSILHSFGKRNFYKELNGLSSKELKKYKNIVLFNIDGLGYEFLKRKCKNSFIFQNLIKSINSVFLPTTVCATSTFDFGFPPQQTGLTGWNMNLKETGSVVTILPFVNKAGGDLSKFDIDINKIIDFPPFTKNFKGTFSSVMPNYLCDTAYTNKVSGKSNMVGYGSIKTMFSQVKKLINLHKRGRHFIKIYDSSFDGFSHDNGINSKKSMNYFLKLDKSFRNFIKKINNTNSLIILVADHGLIDNKNCIWLEDHPKLNSCLSSCLAGEARCVYCYVKPDKAKEFENYVNTKLKKYCWLYKGKDLIDNNFFGLGKPNPKLYDRVGDYVLIMKKNYLLKDRLINQKKESGVGHHAGVSKEEFLVPLVVVDCK